MDAAVHGDCLDAAERSCVNNIDRAGQGADADQNAVPILSNSYIVRPTAELYLVCDFSADAIHNIEHTFRFVAYVDSRPVGGKIDSVRQFDTPNDLHDFVGRRV